MRSQPAQLPHGSRPRTPAPAT